MKKINDISVQPQQAGQTPEASAEQKQTVYYFVLSILSLYGSKGEKLKPEIKTICRQYVSDILQYSPDELAKRLDKIKKLRGLHDDYKWPDDALARAVGPYEVLQHDYSKYYATGEQAKAHKPLLLDRKPSDKTTAKKALDGMRGIFND